MKGPGPDPRPGLRPWEAAGALLALALGFHFLALRIRTAGPPSGDEGSWIAVAAEFAHGRGFTTRWLECPFLVPYALPRPDDFRYPGLVSLLALAFRAFGYSVETARWTVGAIFLAFAASVWGVARRAFGRWAGLAALLATVTSLLQLEWNSAAYTEGLFGLAAAGLAGWCLRGERTRREAGPFAFGTKAWWAGLGACVGLLYLVRVNGILFVPGIAILFWSRRREVAWNRPVLAAAAFILVASPWLARTAIDFGNPLHFAGSGGLLRDPGAAATQSHTLTAAEYFGRHDVLFLPRRLVLGAGRLLRDIHRFEHGLEIIPLALAVCAAARRRSFFGPAYAAGFLLTMLACAYAAYNSWGGVRYASGLLPLAYAYGFSLAPPLFAARVPARPGWVTRALPYAAGALGLLLVASPVIPPHRFYERALPKALAARGPYAYRSAVAGHLSVLESRLPPGGHYYAASLCQLNFLAPDRYCVGLQELYDTTWFARSLAAFHPALVALTPAEAETPELKAALARMRDGGYAPVTLDSGAFAVYYALRPVTAGSAVSR
jgi:hypothetical protein